ncbi:MAG: hypothetical protein HFH58_07900 [Lachnospiraceae bacterium]|nr:hypothetical protein [Lachnospiraceae bacterium]
MESWWIVLDREEFLTKIESINQFVHKKDYKNALEIVESIEWRKVKSARTLCVAGEVYAANRCYQESKEIFLMAYKRSPVRKNILYRLIEVSIKMEDLEDALKYYQEFLEMAPNDNIHFILKYKIYSARKTPLEDQIQILEEYKEREYTERWSYELAKLYYKAGERRKCEEVCDDLVLWFSEGEYVIKALELKMRLTNLTPRQRKIYEEQLREKELREQQDREEVQVQTEENETEQKQSFEQESEPDSESGGQSDTESKSQDSEKPGNLESLSMELYDEEQPRKQKKNDDIVTIVEGNGTLQEKITKGIKDIFAGIVKGDWEEDEDFLEGYAIEPKISMADVIPPETVEENIKEIEEKSSQDEPEDTRPEENEEQPEDQPGESQEHKLQEDGLKLQESEKPEEEGERQQEDGLAEEPADSQAGGQDTMPIEMQELKVQEELSEENQEPDLQADSSEDVEILKAQADFSGENEDPRLQEGQSEVVEIQDLQEKAEKKWPLPKLDVETPEKFDTSRLPELKMPDFNLEEVILSAAEKQGIDVAEKEEEENPSEYVEESTEDIAEAKADESEEEEPEESAEILNIEKVQPEGEIHPQEDTASEEDSLIEFIDSQNSREEEDPDVIVTREQNLDEVEQKLFSYFSTIPGMSQQLVEALTDAQMSASDKTSRTGNIIVMGNLRTGKTRLTEGLVKSICRELHMPAAKTASVEASQLNGRDIAKIVDKMSGGFLVIQKISQLTPESVEQLNQAMEFRTDGLTVILEDEKIGMRKFIAKYPKFTKKFTSTINIPVFTNDELVHFAKVYADEMGYVMDTMGVLALYNLIGDNQKEDEPMTIGTVKDMMDDAITKAESSHRKLQRSISKKRFDDEGKIVLYEKDFK